MARSSRSFSVGYQVTWLGKIARLLFGGELVYISARFILQASPQANLLVALNFAGIFLAYLLAYKLLGERMLSRMNPWFGTLILVAAPVVVSNVSIPGIPVPFQVGLGAYIGAGLLLNVVTNYGGCEVLAFQSLLYGRWYKVYCPLNVFDIAENALAKAGSRAKAPRNRSPHAGAGIGTS